VPPLLSTRLHEDRLGHKVAGEKLAEELQREEQRATEALAAVTGGTASADGALRLPDGVVVLDHYQWCQYFSGRATYFIPPDPPEARQRVRFVVLELDKDGKPEEPDFNSERHKLAVKFYTEPGWTVETVYRWPQDKSKPPRMVLAKVSPPK
jgi:hypothetical protein